MTTSINRRQLLIRAGVGAIGTAAAVGRTPAAVFPEEQEEDERRVEGGWYITVEVIQPSPAMFDALYGFAQGGSFTRIDGRNNAPAVGTWRRAEDGAIIFSFTLFNFVAGVRTGYITAKSIARVDDGTLTGTFTAEGHGIPGFLPRSGTFNGTRIVPEAP
jgi:hypothetical protein